MLVIDDNTQFQIEPVPVEILIVFRNAGVPLFDVLQIVTVIGRFFDFPAVFLQYRHFILCEMQPVC